MRHFTTLEIFGTLLFAVPFCVVILWAFCQVCANFRSSLLKRGLLKTLALSVGFVLLVAMGADKGPVIKPKAALQMCLAYLGRFYPASAPIADKVGADLAEARARNADQDVSIGIDAGHLAAEMADATVALAPDAKRCLIDLDWAHADRAPASPNPLASQIHVQSLVTNGVLTDIHYVSFSEEPSSAPQMYFQYYDAESEQLVKAECVGFPDTVQVVTWANGQPRTNACYRMVNAVPDQYADRSRTWDGEVLFGGPVGSGIQFEASGVFIINDANNSVWRGLTWEGSVGGEPVDFINGILVNPPNAMAASAPLETARPAPLLARLTGLFRAPTAAKKIAHAKDGITVTQGSKKSAFKFGFKNNRKAKK